MSAAQALRAALTAPTETASVLRKADRFPIIWDSGASLSMSPCRTDFVGDLETPTGAQTVQGIGPPSSHGLAIEGVGHVAWSFLDSTGMLRTIKVPAYYVPESKVRLLSTTSLLQAYPNENICMEGRRLILSGDSASKEDIRRPIKIFTNDRTNLHIGYAYTEGAGRTVQQAFQAIITTVSEGNHNLNPADKELLCWHYRLGHLGFR